MKYYRLLIILLFSGTVLQAQPYHTGPDPDTRVRYKNFDALFHDYETHNTMYEEDEDMMTGLLDKKLVSADTVILQEYGLHLSTDGFLLQIIPKHKGDTFKLWYWQKHNLREQFDYRSDGDPADWKKDVITWEGYSPQVVMKDSATYYYHIPNVNHEEGKDWIREHLSLRDTMIVVPSEGSNTAEFMYKGEAMLYEISEMLLKIVRYSNGKAVETRYIRMLVENGC